MFNNMTIQTKLLSSLALIIAISIISGGVSNISISKANKNLASMQEVAAAEDAVSELSAAVNVNREALAAFISSGDLEKKAEYENSKSDIAEKIAAVQKSLEDAALLEKIDHIIEVQARWENDIATKQVELMRSPYTVDLARVIESSEANEKIWNEINADFVASGATLTEKTDQETAKLQSVMKATGVTSLVSSFMTVLTILAVSVFIIFQISRPLKELVNVTNRLVKKDWEVEISGTGRGDEIGQMASALVLFRDNGIENEKLVEIQKVEDEKRLTRAQNIEKMVDDFRKEASEVTNALEQATQEMSSSSVTMSDIAENTNKLSEEVSHSAQSAGNNVNNVASASEELTASIQEISKQLTGTNEQAIDAKQLSEHTVQKMQILENSANEISSVIEIISEIAEQTNLLALNATIEAARAGEAGKGFAVVASEVKSLANETAKATEQVQAQIERIQTDTHEASSFIERISQSIENLTQNMSTIAAAMEEQTSATQEISRNVSEASSGTSRVVANINDVSNATRQTQETSDNVSQVAGELSKKSDSLKQSIQTFISNIQAA